MPLQQIGNGSHVATPRDVDAAVSCSGLFGRSPMSKCQVLGIAPAITPRRPAERSRMALPCAPSPCDDGGSSAHEHAVVNQNGTDIKHSPAQCRRCIASESVRLRIHCHRASIALTKACTKILPESALATSAFIANATPMCTVTQHDSWEGCWVFSASTQWLSSGGSILHAG